MRSWLTAFLLVASCSLRPLSQQLDRAAVDAGPAPAEASLDRRGADARATDAGEPRCPGPVFSESPDPTTGAGWYGSLALDPSSGELHIVHQLLATEDARYTHGRQGQWQTEALTSDGSAGSSSALALGPAGLLHLVTFSAGQGKQLYRARPAGGPWGAAQVFAGTAGVASDLAVDGQGDLHWVTYGKAASEVQYRRLSQGSWSAPLAVETAAAKAGPQLGIGLSPDGGTIWVSLVNAAGELKLCSVKGGALRGCDLLDSDLGDHGTTDLAVDGSGDVQLVYFDSVKREQRFLGQQAGSFGARQTLAVVGGSMAMESAIAAEAGGDLWIAYFNAGPPGLELVRRQAGVLGKPQVLEPTAGRYLSTALGPGGELHVVHQNLITQQLRHTRVCP